jgi:hypothetical protein
VYPKKIKKQNFNGSKARPKNGLFYQFHVIFKKTAENSRDPDWQTPEMVKRNVKMAMRFFKDEVIVHGNRVYFELRSFAFHEMEQSEANRVFSHAVEICAAHLGVEPETLKTESMR